MCFITPNTQQAKYSEARLLLLTVARMRASHLDYFRFRDSDYRSHKAHDMTLNLQEYKNTIICLTNNKTQLTSENKSIHLVSEVNIIPLKRR